MDTPPTKIMIVEDERIVALHLSQQLKKLGYVVTSIAASGDTAIAQARDFRPDIILMDIHIEGDKDGIETALRIKDELHTPVIYLTANSEAATLERAKQTEPFGYIVKPFGERELHATLQMVAQRVTVEERLRSSEERLSLALNAAEMGTWELDPQTRAFVRSGIADHLLGLPADEVSSTLDDFLATLDPPDQQRILDLFGGVSDGRIVKAEVRRKIGQRPPRWLRIQGKSFPRLTVVHDGGAVPERVIGVVQDITERRQTEETLRQAAMVFDTTQDGIAILDESFMVITVNAALLRMTGLAESALLQNPLALLDGGDGVRSDIAESLTISGEWRGEIEGRRQNGTVFPARVTIATVFDERGGGEPAAEGSPGPPMSHYVVVVSDITAIRRAEEELRHLAHYDPLTGLPNRLLGMDRLEHALAQRTRDGGRLALMFVDLDHFKEINDALGHEAGDRLLKVAAKRIRDAVRAEDTVARLGGDEFMVILDRVEPTLNVEALAGKVLTAAARPLDLGGQQVSVTASIGISFFPDDDETAAGLIRAADTAMYVAKERGRSRSVHYTSAMTVNILHARSQSQELRRAIKEKEFRFFYQPQIDLRTGRVSGVEALIRWQHPREGLLGAARVVPATELDELAIDVADWCIHEAARQNRQWQDEGLGDIRVAVNLSAQQMRHARIPRIVEDALSINRLTSDSLEIEITENMLQTDAGCLNTLHRLREMHVGVAIDDFGTGYSCLNSIRLLPISRLKIDQSFVHDLPDDNNAAAIAEVIICLAQKLGLGVVAEGVETVAQAGFLQSMGCNELQGYLYARPLPANEAADLIRSRPGNGLWGPPGLAQSPLSSQGDSISH